MRLLLAGLLLALPAGAAPSVEVVAFDDPPGDADGPGTYVPPADGELSAADFDLTRFSVSIDGADAVFAVTLGRIPREPSVTQRTQYTALSLTNGIWAQNIDIYLDTSLTPGGFSACVPGRRVSFGAARTWERAVVLTPQPSLARAASADLGPALEHVHFAQPVQVRGRTVVARVPLAFLGGAPTREWGYAVHVSGASWETNFQLVDRVTGKNVASAYTMPVVTTPERWAFGGGPLGTTHPQVIDLLDGGPLGQHEALSSFDVERGTQAKVGFVYVRPPPEMVAEPTAPRAAPALASAHTVVDLSGDVVTVAGPTAGLGPMMIGNVLDGDGRAVARVVVVRLLETGVLASVVDHKERIAAGAGVRFASPRVPAAQPAPPSTKGTP